jgi:hypothetical protein
VRREEWEVGSEEWEVRGAKGEWSEGERGEGKGRVCGSERGDEGVRW